MTRVVRIYQHGGPEQLRFEELDIGEPQIVAAHRDLESNQQVGKNVVTV
jgi:hypothetical protein